MPTRGAGHHLSRLYEVQPPAIVTRDELYLLFNARLQAPLDILTGSEREVILHTAARQTADAGVRPPFQLRPGLVAEMMRFYDQLRRQGQSVDRYEELLVASLDADNDRGAERLLRQTRFLAASYRAYEQRLGTLTGVDEHGLRAHLIGHAAASPLRRVVVGVADWIADPDGLFAVDFDLLTRIPGLEELDIVATSGLLASGFEQRLHDWLPGLDTVDADSLGLRASLVPTIAAPVREDGVPVWVHRDREEELVAVARRAADNQDPADCTAVVFARPLPYLYLAHEVFRSAGIAHQAVDRLPLAAEPAAAALDLIIEFVSSGFTRTSALALLRSPQLAIGAGLTRQALTGLDRALHEKQYLGDIERLRRLASDFDGDAEAREALAAVVRAADALLPLTEAAPASTQLTVLSSFLAAHASPGAGARSGRACSAIVGVLRSLAAAHGWHGDRVATIDDLAPDIRRWIEEQTFEPHTSTGRRAPARLPGRALRRFRHGHDRRADRRRVARTRPPQHLLLAGGALGARLAV